jgi:hypothetical protein
MMIIWISLQKFIPDYMNLYKGPEELFERLDDSTIQRLLNDVA